MINQQKIDNLAQAIRDAIDTQITAYNDDLMATLNGETTAVTFILEFAQTEQIDLSEFYSNGCSVKIYENDYSTPLATQEVNSDEVTFDNIPNGTYHIVFDTRPSGVDGAFWGVHIQDSDEEDVFTVDSSHRRFTLYLYRAQQ